jgi:hypothetical protein
MKKDMDLIAKSQVETFVNRHEKIIPTMAKWVYKTNEVPSANLDILETLGNEGLEEKGNIYYHRRYG